MSKHVLGHDQLPASPPVAATIAAGLLLDRIRAHPVIWGVVGTLFAILWVGTVYRWATEEAATASDLVYMQRKEVDE